MIRDILRFLWRRDADSACLLIIGIADHMSIKDLKSMSDYLKQSADYYERYHRDKVHEMTG